MTIINNLPIDSIKADSNQPRKRFNQKDLEDLAQGIKSEGIINPIEIDDNNIIITGERRWRAAKIAGLKKVPCFIGKEMSKKERFKHQLIENVHHNTMSDIDTAKALKKTLINYGKFIPGKKLQGSDQGMTWLSNEIGKSVGYVWEKLILLDQTKEFQEAIDDGVISSTSVRAINAAPKKHKKIIEKRIVKEILALDLKDDTVETGIIKINKVLDGKKEFLNGSNIITTAKKLVNLLDKCPVTEVSETNRPFMVLVLSELRTRIISYMNNQTVK